ncbi:50S ribosome-binding GTPase [Helicobacter winghamensis ATCC BAA-430]|nr:FeoB small GTPase domain-containing protein [Helicobacter winghamensis]
MKHLNIALIGQPNCGKSTIFNLFSPIKQHIANYPGITIDKKARGLITEIIFLKLLIYPVFIVLLLIPKKKVSL